MRVTQFEIDRTGMCVDDHLVNFNRNRRPYVHTDPQSIALMLKSLLLHELVLFAAAHLSNTICIWLHCAHDGCVAGGGGILKRTNECVAQAKGVNSMQALVCVWKRIIASVIQTMLVNLSPSLFPMCACTDPTAQLHPVMLWSTTATRVNKLALRTSSIPPVQPFKAAPNLRTQVSLCHRRDTL